jgi:pyruvate/2-oxoglutarate/acetoin dehydrogenase E1 component
MLGEIQSSVEIIDIRTLIPLDMDAILRSVRMTGKVLIVHEDNITGDFGGEIAARIAAEGFEYLDAPFSGWRLNILIFPISLIWKIMRCPL